MKHIKGRGEEYLSCSSLSWYMAKPPLYTECVRLYAQLYCIPYTSYFQQNMSVGVIKINDCVRSCRKIGSSCQHYI